MEHSQIILSLLKKKNISAYRLAKDTGISVSLFSKWKKNPTSEISSSNLTRIADYFDCSVDYLLGRITEPSLTANVIDGNVTDSAVVQDLHHNNLTINGNSECKLTDEETELLRLFKFLDVRRRTKILDLAFTLEEEAKAESS